MKMSYGRGTGGRGRGIGFLMRLGIAVFIALFAVGSYFMSTQRNPFTGEDQRVGMSVPEEILTGQETAPVMIQQMGGLHPDQQAQAAVNAVGQRLVSVIEQLARDQGGANPYPFQFHLLRDDRTVNAFALPGGQVFMTSGLYARLQTEGQLAGVLGHEIGHVIGKHGAERLAQMRLQQGLSQAVGVAAGSVDAAQVAQQMGEIYARGYGRDDELEADEWGIRLNVRAGYDPRAMLGVMKILEQASGGNSPPEFLSTHPNPRNRMEHIEQVIRAEFPSGLPQGLTP